MKTSIKRSICIGLVILAIVGIAGCVGSNEQKSEVSQPAAEVTTPAAEVTTPISEPTTAPGTVIVTFSGDDSTTTQQFTAPNKWKIEWETQNSTKYKETVFSMYLCNENGEQLDYIGSTYEADSGETYMYKPGTYTFDITSGMPYNITVKTA